MPSNLTIGVGLDLSKLIADKAALQLQMKDLAAKLRDATKAGDSTAVGELSTDLARATVTLSGVNREMAKLRTESKGGFSEIRAAFGELVAAGREFRASMSEMADRIIPHFREIAALTFGAAAIELSKMTIEAAKATREVDNLSKSFGVSVEFVEKLKLAGAQAGADPERQFRALGRVMEKIGEAREDVLKLQQDIQNGVPGAEAKARQQLSTFGDSGSIFRGGVRPQVDYSKPLSVLGLNVGSFADSQAGNEKMILAIGAAFDRMASATVRATVARQVFGREWENMLPVVMKLADQLNAAKKAIEEYGLGTEEAEERQARAFNRSYETLRFVIERIKTITGNILGQAFVPLMDGIADLLGRNVGAIKRWAYETAAAAGPVVKDILGLLKGGSLADVKTPWLADFLGALKAIGQAVVVIKDVAVEAFRAMKAALDPVAELLNATFGTKLTGEVVAFGLLITGLAGGFPVLVAAVTLALAPFGLLKSAVLWLGGAESLGSVAALGTAIAGLATAAGVAAALIGAKLGGDLGAKWGASIAANRKSQWAEADITESPENIRRSNGPNAQFALKPQSPWPFPMIPIKSLDDLPFFGKKLKALEAGDAAPAPAAASDGADKFGDKSIPQLITQTAEQYNRMIDNLKTSGKETAKILENGIAKQVEVLRGGVSSIVQTLTGSLVHYRPSQPYTPPNIPGQSGVGGGGQGVAFATGGAVSGPGTGTSDSIAAWLSNGEYVLNADVVRRVGRNFLDAMNFSRMPRFADGGFVGAGASGADLGGPWRPVVFNIGGWSHGLMGRHEVVEALKRHAADDQVASGGTKPSWYGGKTSL